MNHTETIKYEKLKLENIKVKKSLDLVKKRNLYLENLIIGFVALLFANPQELRRIYIWLKFHYKNEWKNWEYNSTEYKRQILEDVRNRFTTRMIENGD